MTYSEMKKDVPDCAYSHKLHLCFSLENIEGDVLASFFILEYRHELWQWGTSEEIEYSFDPYWTNVVLETLSMVCRADQHLAKATF